VMCDTRTGLHIVQDACYTNKFDYLRVGRVSVNLRKRAKKRIFAHMKSDDFVTQFLDRKSQGIPIGEAWETTRLEHGLKSWPIQWGNYLHVKLYGGIHITNDIDIPTLGIHISSNMKTGDFFPFYYVCQVKVKSRDMAGFLDALERIEIFVNSCSVALSLAGGSPTKGAGASIHYYCRFLSDAGATALTINDYIYTINSMLDKFYNHPTEQHPILLRAMWWMRQARHDFLSGNLTPSIFSLYLSYWNAFECLVNYACEINPLGKLSRSKKEKMVTSFFHNLSASPSLEDIEKCYREIINPGLKERAKHALTSVLGQETGESFYSECFAKNSRADSLYQIRNDIDHGSIVEYDLSTWLRVINGLNRLQGVVLSFIHVLLSNNRDK
jgi:hypothetical protein